MEYPPILPDIKDELKDYLLCPGNLPIHQYERTQELWPRKPNPKELLYFEGSPVSTTLKVHRDLTTGEIIEFRETPIEFAGATAKNSMSFHRAPAPPSEATRGNPLYVPFWPGSFPKPQSNESKSKKSGVETELLTIPPGFDKGLIFAEDGYTVLRDCNESERKKLVINRSNLTLRDVIGTDIETPESQNTESISKPKSSSQSLPEEDEVIPNEPPVLKISTTPSLNSIKETDWVVLLDTTKPVEDFHEKIPKMAREYEFELDTFQKLAILQLEQHNHVFVAAHTSAGKTVVAEYAIALSQQHKTRTIYTSPIKALSNQKYREFKKDFKDVGLITGDFQINQKASCLIMTTEILRSMLYRGSEIARDLEYVIFDEVHYINDRERGHVWEQALIMLPPQVCVVLLSATVPNTMEFADWLGRTHQKKVYVVTTFMRPVPLQHFLYTGRDKDTKDNMFKILDADRWTQNGYMKAKESLKNVDQRNSFQKMNPQQEKKLWVTLIGLLEKKDLLPVVAFTFSRQKCDNNASNLLNLDLTNNEEKEHIKIFFNKCIGSLKQSDQTIPQILKMKETLIKGIGVHHSGILPIIKEIVEMLFQDGYIKLLFATETFAMGVNMPARTVVFDSTRKHDGHELRDLQPAEYIQMAGRAGRRRLDKEGTVIILCKLSLPLEDNLRKMMLGKPSSLVSQFRLTYGMVLSLLRFESLTVEGMMSRSFGEAEKQKSMIKLEKTLLTIKKQIEELGIGQLNSGYESLLKFYDCANEYLQERQNIMVAIMMSPKVQKAVVPGRIVMITHKNHMNKLALILSTVSGKQQYKVLVLSDETANSEKNIKEDIWYYMIALSKDKLFIPLYPIKHEILTISPIDVFEITSKTLQVKTELIVNDVEKRQMERFKDAPPGQTCVETVQELLKLSQSFNNQATDLRYLHLTADLKVNEHEMFYKVKNMYDLKAKLLDVIPATKIPDFEEQFFTVFTKKFLEQKKKNIEYMLSTESLSLYPDYENRTKLLKRWNYVDNQNRVQLKGRVACEMGMNELLITELILRNVLNKLRAPEVAAILSALVYRVKVKQDEIMDFEDLPANLRKAIKEMQKIHGQIAEDEVSLQIQTDEFQEDLNFGLVYIVYEWALNKPFAQIMQLTNIQEGIIVRCIQQLNEIICDIKDAASIIGDPNLQSKMDETSAAIKRDIVFVQSLYMEDERSHVIL